jgi:ribose transport system permease protein
MKKNKNYDPVEKSAEPNDVEASSVPDLTDALPSGGNSSWLRTWGPVLAVFAVWLFFALMVPITQLKFWPESYTLPANAWFSLDSLTMMTRHVAVVGVAAIGMTFVIIAAGIDLSIGSMIALVTVVIAITLNKLVPEEATAIYFLIPVAAALAGVAMGAIGGAAQGFLITKLKVVPFIITLGGMLIFRGVAKGLSNQQTVSCPETFLNSLLADVHGTDMGWMILPPGVWLFLVLAVIAACVLRYTRFGRHVFAIGSNEETARLCGIGVERVKCSVFAIAGAAAGVAGMLEFSELQLGDPTTSNGAELDVIAAVVIGGGSLSGGEGSILGTIAGAMIVVIITTGCALMGLQTWARQIATGGIIIAAVAFDQLRHRRAA